MFLQEVKQLINLHGVTITYVTVTEGAYNIETGSVTNTETSTSFKAYPKRIRATQFNYPNLIGRTVFELLVPADALATVPRFQDKISMNSEYFTVESTSTITAEGSACLLMILVTKQ